MDLAAGILAFWLPETLSRDATDRGASIGMERGLQPFCCKKPQIQGPRGRKEVAKEGEDATLV